MARIEADDLLKTANRYAVSVARQNAQVQSGMEGLQLEAEMLNKRRAFLDGGVPAFLESIVEGSDLFPMRYFGIGQIAARCVGRIHVALQSTRSEGFGTGFLVAPGVLLTNQHVLQSQGWAAGATLTMDAEDSIEGLPMVPRIFAFDPERLYFADYELDFCLVGVAAKAIDGTPLSDYGHFRLFPATGKIVRDEYVTIIQHPGGRQKHVAVRNNKVSVYVYDDPSKEQPDPDNDFIYYATDTLSGSSGAPVLSDQWYVVALHRRGVPLVKKRRGQLSIIRQNGRPAAPDDPEEVVAFVSNEGVRISRIMARLAKRAESNESDSAHARVALDAISKAAGKRADGPLSTPTTRYQALRDRWEARPLFTRPRLEIIKRKVGLFPEEVGYDDDFLNGFRLPLPKPRAALMAQLAPRIDMPDKQLLPFRHFTTVMHAQRRLPVFAAINISPVGKPDDSMPNRPAWSYDPRIDLAHQPDDSIFSNMLQRGHVAAREYIYWGHDAGEIKQADVHSFTLTNVCPQIARFNGNKEWYEIERQIAKGVAGESLLVSEFVGPIFGQDDPDYDDLKRESTQIAEGASIKLPLRFWKIVMWVEDGELKHKALLLDQSKELDEAGPLEFDIETPDGVTETTVAEISELTDLDFPDVLLE